MKIYHYLRWKLIKAAPVIDAGFSVHDVLSRYFKNEDLKISMSFQAKYLGMSPWDCPGAFTILSYVEHAFGIYHPKGGVHKISEAMAEILKEEGGKINLNSSVKEIIFKKNQAVGLKLESGQEIFGDEVIMNVDFADGVSKLIRKDGRKKYTDQRLESMKYSCSTFMIYLGVNKKYNLSHHSIFLAENYKKNVEDIFKNKIIPEDPSFYLQNAGLTDDSLAGFGKSTFYCLVPVPNLLNSEIDWEKEKTRFRNKIIEKIVEKTGFSDLKNHIEVEKIITPLDWQEKMNVFGGAVFNLSHSLDQMLYFRPHNRLEGYKNLYIVGGGTHPGSGLPTIIESGRISADLIYGLD